MTQDQWSALLKALQELGNPTWTDWVSAIAAGLTFVVALVAAVIALRQLTQARELEREKAQPYVVAFMEESPLGPEAMDLVVRNYGQTAAREVRMTFEPKLYRAYRNEDVYLPEVIPILAPGQEWRTLLDFSRARFARTDLSQRYEGTVRYLGLDNEARESKAIIDWATYKEKTWAQYHGLNELAKAGIGVLDEMKKWTEGINDGVSVFVRSGHRKDAEREKFFREMSEQDEAPVSDGESGE